VLVVVVVVVVVVVNDDDASWICGSGSLALYMWGVMGGDGGTTKNSAGAAAVVDPAAGAAFCTRPAVSASAPPFALLPQPNMSGPE